jgi:hypothetical protein
MSSDKNAKMATSVKKDRSEYNVFTAVFYTEV